MLGGNLRRHLAAWGYSFDLLLDSGLISVKAAMPSATG